MTIECEHCGFDKNDDGNTECNCCRWPLGSSVTEVKVPVDGEAQATGAAKKIYDEIAIATAAPPKEQIERKEEDVLGFQESIEPPKRKRGRPRKIT